MEKYTNPTERVANQLYDYIKITDKGKEKSKRYSKKGNKFNIDNVNKRKLFKYDNYNTAINNLQLIDIKIAIREEDDLYCYNDDVFNNVR